MQNQSSLTDCEGDDVPADFPLATSVAASDGLVDILARPRGIRNVGSISWLMSTSGRAALISRPTIGTPAVVINQSSALTSASGTRLVRVRTCVKVCLFSLAALGISAGAHAQTGTPSTAANTDEHTINVWALAGVNAAIDSRWHATVRFGYLDGFESRILATDLTFAPWAAIRLLAGHVYVDPAESGSDDIYFVRGGCIWRPIRGRLELENRALIDRRSGAARPARIRDRVMVSLPTNRTVRLRVFGSVEMLATAKTVVGQRYQAGASRSVGPATMEVYWAQDRSRGRDPFNALGLTAFWRIGSP